MVDPGTLGEVAQGLTIEYLKKQGYEVSEVASDKSARSYVEAEKFKKKFLFAVKAIARGENALFPPGSEELLYEQKRDLLAHCSKLAAIAMLALVEFEGESQEEAKPVEPIRFKRL